MPAANNDIFNILQIQHLEGSITASLNINPNSKILKGHFPGQPVVPGACMLQVVKEVLESALNDTLRLKKADHLKFMSLIEPGNNQTVQLEITYREIEEGDIFATAKLFAGEIVCFKLQGTFIKMPDR
jgi:3-hydroxyacyl-[acyl-carrier-protein] dehydratase